MAMTNDPRLTPLVAALPATVPFVGPETQERDRGRVFAARLGANENGFGPSPKVLEAIRDGAPDVWKYGDAGSHDLRHAVAGHLGVNPAHVIIGEGIDGLLGNLVRMTVEPGVSVVASAGSYPTFAYHVRGYGGTLHTVPFKGDHEDPEALAAKAHEVGAKLVYLSNPDNPMASWHDGATVQRLIEALPEGALLVLDEAYIEMAPEGTAPLMAPEDPRVIRFRTFSKAYGLAGMRMGYAIGSADLIAAFGRIGNHFGVNRLGQAAALAALRDQSHLADTLAKIDRARQRIAGIADENGLSALPSATNFVAIDCGADGDFARAVLAELTERDNFVRMPGLAPQDRCIRVSCGPDTELDRFAAALPEALAAARSR